MAGFDDIPEIALRWTEDGKSAAIATVVQTWGSAPRPVGSQLAISSEGELAGSVSGGCVEGAVVAEAMELMLTGQTLVMEFGVSDDQAFAVGLACGGQIRVMIEPVGTGVPVQMLRDLVAARAARQAVAYVVHPDTGARRLAGPEEFGPRFRNDASGFEEDGHFIAIHNPPLRLAIVGAVHIAQPLAQMADLAGYDMLICDPRESFASEGRFPGKTLSHDWPDEALEAFGLDARTAVVTLTHDPKLDDPAILSALRSDVFYIGCLGSTRTHAKRLDRLMQQGIAQADLDRIHGPVGLDIGARSPAEIAVSIMAELTQALRRP